jgi:hypothetical protein
MPGALILDIPLGLGLALMAVIGSHFLEAERGLCNDMIDERNRVSMRLLVTDLSALTRIASSIALYWNWRNSSPRLPMKVRNLTSVWM